jgi:hypothetical protein
MIPLDVRSAKKKAHPRAPSPEVLASLPEHYLVGTRSEPWSSSCQRLPTAWPEKPRCAQRVALCLTGSARTFVRSHVYRSVATNLMGGLQASKTDVFIVTRLDDVEPKGQVGYNHERIDASKEALLEALTPLAPRAVLLDTGNASAVVYGVPHNSECVVAGFMGESRNRLMRSVAQPASWAACLRLVKQAEAEMGGRQYDVVVKSRADLLWFYPHPRVCSLAPNTIYTHSWIDHHFVLPRHLADEILSTVERYTTCRGQFAHRTVERWLGEAISRAVGAQPPLMCRQRRASPLSPVGGGAGAGAGLEVVMFPAGLVRTNSTDSDARVAAREYCASYVLMGRQRPGQSPGPPPCDVSSPETIARLHAALSQCLRRAYPEEARTLRVSSHAMREWWSKSSLCMQTSRLEMRVGLPRWPMF